MNTILVFIGIFIIGAIVLGLILGSRSAKKAKTIERRLRDLPDFAPADVYVSGFSLTGIAIDRERREIALADYESLWRFGIRSIVDTEVLQDGVQITSSNRGSQVLGAAVGGVLFGGLGALAGGLSGSKRGMENIRRVVLRITTDDFNHPIHDLVLIDWSFIKKGLSSDNALYKETLKIAELWHGRLSAMMKAGYSTAV